MRSPIKRITAATTVVGVTIAIVTSSASGNSNAVTLDLNFQTGGRLVAVNVRPGDHVHAGEVLAQIDPAQARVGIQTAEAGVQTAQAQLLHLTEGLSAADRAKNAATLAQALGALHAAEQTERDAILTGRAATAAKQHARAQARENLTTAQATGTQDAAVHQASVDQAESQLQAANTTLSDDRARLATDQLAETNAAVAVNADHTGVTQAQAQLAAASTQLQAAKNTQYSDGCTVQGTTTPPTACAADAKAIDDATTNLTNDQSALADHQTAFATEQANLSQADNAVASDTTAIRSDGDAARQAQDALTSAQLSQQSATVSTTEAIQQAAAAVTNARDAFQAARLANLTTSHTDAANVQAARLNLNQTRATIADAAQPPRPDTLLTARASLNSATATLANAQIALGQTELRAPAAGIITAVNGNIGEIPGTSGPPAPADPTNTGNAFITLVAFETPTR